jgi:hypothetical protein
MGLLLVGVVLAVAGCGGAGDKGGDGGQADGTNLKANLDKLPAADRKLAEAQKLCPVSGERLGSMGVPVKVEVEGEPVFLCCASCRKEARDNPKETLARARKLRTESAGTSR